MEEEKQAMKHDLEERRKRQNHEPTYSSTPRPILKGYDPFGTEGAMSKVNDGKYNRKNEGDEGRRVTIGDTQTKEISGNMGSQDEQPMKTDHSYGSLHPFADETIQGNHQPPAPVYNITYQYGPPHGQNTGVAPTGTQGMSQTYPMDGNNPPRTHKNDPTTHGTKGTEGIMGMDRKKLTRRASMTPAMMVVYDSDPNIQTLGKDCCSRTVEEASDVMDWSRRQSDRLVWSTNAARKTTRTPKRFMGTDWKECYQDFCDHNRYHGWDKEASLGPLIKWLSDGPGRIAVDDWRTGGIMIS